MKQCMSDSILLCCIVLLPSVVLFNKQTRINGLRYLLSGHCATVATAEPSAELFTYFVFPYAAAQMLTVTSKADVNWIGLFGIIRAKYSYTQEFIFHFRQERAYGYHIQVVQTYLLLSN